MHILAYDLGTSGIKTGLFSEEGEILCEAYREYPVFYPHPGWAEGRPEDWWNALCEGTRRVFRESGIPPREVGAVGISGMGGAMIPVDREGNALVDYAMVWMDMRATEEAQEMLRRVPETRMDELTRMYGKYASCLAARHMWVRKHAMEIYHRAYKFLGVREYLICRLTGSMDFCGYSDAVSSGIYNIVANRNEEELLNAFEIEPDKLLAYAEATRVAGEVSSSGAVASGISRGTPVVVGCWDNMACMLGGGGSLPENFVCYLGTAAWIGTISDRCLRRKERRFMTGRLDNRLIYNSVNSHSAGPAFNWVLDNSFLTADNYLDRPKAYEEAEKAASAVPAGCEGLSFLPAFYGGNSIYESESMAGTFLGVRPVHTRGHMLRSAMEGAGLDMLLGFRMFEGFGAKVGRIRVIGGGSRNQLWIKILASMFQKPIERIQNPQHCGVRGAMLLAGIGAGIYSDYDQIEGMIKTVETVEPNPAWAGVYEEAIYRHRVFYEALLPAYQKGFGENLPRVCNN